MYSNRLCLIFQMPASQKMRRIRKEQENLFPYMIPLSIDEAYNVNQIEMLHSVIQICTIVSIIQSPWLPDLPTVLWISTKIE